MLKNHINNNNKKIKLVPEIKKEKSSFQIINFLYLFVVLEVSFITLKFG